MFPQGPNTFPELLDTHGYWRSSLGNQPGLSVLSVQARTMGCACVDPGPIRAHHRLLPRLCCTASAPSTPEGHSRPSSLPLVLLAGPTIPRLYGPLLVGAWLVLWVDLRMAKTH